MSDLAELAVHIGEVLLAQHETVACCEATTGGLISASLQGVPRASRFYQASIIVYSYAAAHELIPKALRKKVFVPNYADPNFGVEQYRQSKVTFALEMAEVRAHFKLRFCALTTSTF